MHSTEERRRVAFHPQVAFRVVDGEGVVVLAQDGQVEVVNPIGARVLELAESVGGVQEIAAQITEEYEVPASEARRDVAEFIEAMIDEKVLVWAQ